MLNRTQNDNLEMIALMLRKEAETLPDDRDMEERLAYLLKNLNQKVSQPPKREPRRVVKTLTPFQEVKAVLAKLKISASPTSWESWQITRTGPEAWFLHHPWAQVEFIGASAHDVACWLFAKPHPVNYRIAITKRMRSQ